MTDLNRRGLLAGLLAAAAAGPALAAAVAKPASPLAAIEPITWQFTPDPGVRAIHQWIIGYTDGKTATHVFDPPIQVERGDFVYLRLNGDSTITSTLVRPERA